MSVTPLPAPQDRGAALAVWSGLLLIDKPAGLTSHDAVEKVRRRMRAKGAGHLGTLDPGATGLLVVAMGAATRCATVWQGGDKLYEATLRLGVSTTTQDLHGEVVARREVHVTEAELLEAAGTFVGTIEQVPPMVSALKVGGQRLHRLARRGEVVERAPRTIRVESWEWLSITLPDATFRVRCSGGTYVRTLVHDLGERLGCGAALASLRRLRSEPFGVERAIPLRALDGSTPEAAREAAGVPLDEALAVLPAVTLDEEQARELGYGRKPSVDPKGAPIGAGPRSVVMVGPPPGDDLPRSLALGELVPDPADPDRALACPHTVFPWAVRENRL